MIYRSFTINDLYSDNLLTKSVSYSLGTLEFPHLLDLIARNAQTPMGRDAIISSLPFSSRLELENSLDAIRETIRLNEEKQISWTFSGLEDPSEHVAVLAIENATLDALALLDIAHICTQSLYTRSAIQPEKENFPMLWSIVEAIPLSLLNVIEEISRKILPGGEIDDSASPQLAELRREINQQRNRLTRSLESAMRAAGNAIQDQIVTVRNERFVIPVKADFRGSVTGVAHGFSSSGQTIYIEPLAAIEANNELQNLRGKEEREIAKILFTLTEKLRFELHAVEQCVKSVAILDAIKTKVEFTRAFRCSVPEITDDGTLDLIDARHPLLEDSLRKFSDDRKSSNEVVPSSFGLNNEHSVMIISGANAGGKTVVMKTAGLLSLMAISGLPLPAKKAKVPFYKSILADIGDHQSLSANLSTFSSHMSNIASMIRDCSPPSLVLLDEAGTGTDPDEGSALGVAIVDHFRKQGAQVIASTHYRGLKMYAANDPSVINASVEFDEKTLQPTYKLLLGMAGASSGIEIARRFGIDDMVIAAARSELDTAGRQSEEYLIRLQSETRKAEDLRKALEEERDAVAAKYAGLEIEAVHKEKRRQREFESKLAETINDFERQSTAFIKTIEDKALRNRLDKERASRKAQLNRAVVDKMFTAETKHESRQISSTAHNATGSQSPRSKDLTVGSQVLTSFGKAGKVVRIDGDVAQVLVGSIHLREKLDDLRIAETQTSATTQKFKPVNTDVNEESRTTDVELNLIGLTTADAEYELDRFIDEAYLSRTPRIRIIHGFGTGALKNFVHHFLKSSDLIAKYEFAPSSQGGNGATIAEIRFDL